MAPARIPSEVTAPTVPSGSLRLPGTRACESVGSSADPSDALARVAAVARGVLPLPQVVGAVQVVAAAAVAARRQRASSRVVAELVASSP